MSWSMQYLLSLQRDPKLCAQMLTMRPKLHPPKRQLRQVQNPQLHGLLYSKLKLVHPMQ